MSMLTWSPATGGAAPFVRLAVAVGCALAAAWRHLPLLHGRRVLRDGRSAARPRPMALRIDVTQAFDDIEAELATLQRRLATPGDALHGTATLPLDVPGFVFRHREADGEHYVYVEDIANGRLAGYTVFNRLIEVDRRTDPHVRSPHSRYAPAYRRRGLATAVYRWALGRSFCLVSGARQSAAAHALWYALGRRHVLGFVSLQRKEMRFLSHEAPPSLRDDLHTRMILLGDGWRLDEAHGRTVVVRRQ